MVDADGAHPQKATMVDAGGTHPQNCDHGGCGWGPPARDSNQGKKRGGGGGTLALAASPRQSLLLTRLHFKYRYWQTGCACRYEARRSKGPDIRRRIHGNGSTRSHEKKGEKKRNRGNPRIAFDCEVGSPCKATGLREDKVRTGVSPSRSSSRGNLLSNNCRGLVAKES